MSYKKGALYERELLKILRGKGFSALRVAGSGGNTTPMDVLAIKKGTIYAFEIKAHIQKPRLSTEQLNDFVQWCQDSWAHGFLAWRTNKNKWLFLPLDDAKQKNYDDENWLSYDSLFSIIDFQK